MKIYAFIIAMLFSISCNAADFALIFYTDAPSEVHVYNAASNCIRPPTTSSSSSSSSRLIADNLNLTYICQTQQFVSISRGDGPLHMNGNQNISIASFNFVTGSYVTHTVYTKCKNITPSDQTGVYTIRYSCKQAKAPKKN